MFSVFATLLIGPLATSTIAFISGLRLRNLARIGVRGGYGWHKYFVNQFPAMASVSCIYFIGTNAEVRAPDTVTIARYVGEETLRHVE